MRLLWAFLVRDFYEEVSYRVSFIMSMVGIFFNTLTFFFLSETFGSSAGTALQQYDTDYFSFVLIGIAFNAYFSVGLTGFSRGIRSAQRTGTLEAILMTPAPLSSVVTGSALWSYAFTTFRMVVTLALGSVLGVSFANANIIAGLVVLFLSVVAFASMGIISAGIIMVIKRGDPLTTLLTYLTTLLGGIFYPVEVLPNWLEPISRVLPITYAINAMRMALLNGAGWTELLSDLLVLLGFCVFLFPVSLFVFRYAVEKSRADGSLTHY